MKKSLLILFLFSLAFQATRRTTMRFGLKETQHTPRVATLRP